MNHGRFGKVKGHLVASNSQRPLSSRPGRAPTTSHPSTLLLHQRIPIGFVENIREDGGGNDVRGPESEGLHKG